MSNLKKFAGPFRLLVYPVISGLALALAFPKPYISILAWVALIPLLRILLKENWWRCGLAGMLAGFAFFGGLLYWVGLFGLKPWLGISFLMSLYVAVFGLGTRFLRELPRRWPLLTIPALWTSIEFLRSVGSWGFSWGLVGTSQQSLILLQILKVTGVFGLSYLIVLVNLLAAARLLMADPARQPSAKPLADPARQPSAKPLAGNGEVAVGVAAVLVVALFGWTQLTRGPETGSAGQGATVVKTALLQGNISQDRKFDTTFTAEVMERYLRLTDEAARRGARLIIWPETSFPGLILEDYENLLRITSAARRWKAWLIVGSLHRSGQDFHNSAFVVSPSGRVSGRYDKIHLVPFGEYIPFRRLLQNIPELQQIAYDLTAGTEYKVLRTGLGRIASVVCFESSDPFLIRHMVSHGSRLVVVVTNDGWFGRTAAAEQHFQLARSRAIENGIYVAQAANTGISGIITPTGEIKARSRLNSEAGILGEVLLRDGGARSRTVYTRFGDIFSYLALSLSAVGLLIGLVLVRRGTNQISHGPNGEYTSSEAGS